MSAAPEGDPELARAQERAFAELTAVGEHIEAQRATEAAAAAHSLGELFAARPADAMLSGFGAMVLDAVLWLIAGGLDADALELCGTLVDRLAAGSDTERGIAAGARFLAAQAAGRLGEAEPAREQLEALATMGEPALAGLERIAGRLAGAGAPAAWHAQVAAASATILWRLGRVAQARTLARETSASFARLGQPELEARLAALEREIAGDG